MQKFDRREIWTGRTEARAEEVPGRQEEELSVKHWQRASKRTGGRTLQTAETS